MRACLCYGLLAALLAGVAASDASAQSSAEEPYAPVNRSMESSDLPPVLLPVDLWRGLDAATAEK